MVICYRFMVSSLQIYGHLLQKYGAIHRHPALLLQIYGLKAFATPLDALLLQIYGRWRDGLT